MNSKEKESIEEWIKSKRGEVIYKSQIDAHWCLLEDSTKVKTEERLESIVGVKIPKQRISDISPLKSLLHLERLWIWSTTVIDIEPLSRLKKLHMLSLLSKGIVNMQPLSKMKSMRVLGLSSNGITEIGALANLNALEYLNLASNRIRDISPLEGLINLKVLMLLGNPISKEQRDELRKVLPKLSSFR